MKIKFILGGLLATITLGTYSATAQTSRYDGLYMGLDATYDITKYKQREITSLTGFIPTDDRSIYNDEGPAAGIFLGYRLTEGRFTVATEGRYGYSFLENKVSAGDNFKLTNEYGGSILPGYWISPEVILYTRFGFSQLTTIRIFDGVINENSDSGFHFGAGIQFYASEKMSIRGEYNRSSYENNISQVILDTSTDPATPVVASSINKIRRDRFQVSLIYKF